MHILLYSALTILSFASFEILFKFESAFSTGIKFANVNGTYIPTDESKSNSANKGNTAFLDLPFLTNPLSLSIVYLLSTGLFLMSSIPIYSLALNKYKSKYEKLRNCFLTIIETNKTLNHSHYLQKMGTNIDSSLYMTGNEDQASNIGTGLVFKFI